MVRRLRYSKATDYFHTFENATGTEARESFTKKRGVNLLLYWLKPTNNQI